MLSDLIQEVASRGVAVVYDRSDADTRSTLVKSLVGGLSSEKQGLKPTGVDGSADREVFGVDSSALGKASGLWRSRRDSDWNTALHPWACASVSP